MIASEALSLGIVYRNEGVRSYRNKHVYTYTHIQAETTSGKKKPMSLKEWVWGGMYGKVWRKEKREMLQFNLKTIKK